MLVNQLLEMAKRTTPDDFYRMAVAMYGKDKVKSMKMPEVVAVAKKNDVQVPAYVVKQKVGRGLFNLEPAGEKSLLRVDRIEFTPCTGYGAYGRCATLYWKGEEVGSGTGATDDESIIEALMHAGLTYGQASDARIDLMKTKPKIVKHPDIKEDPQYANGKKAKTAEPKTAKSEVKDEVNEEELKRIAKEIVSSLKQMSRVYQTADIDVSEWKGKKTVSAGVRDWGQWKVPDDEEDDGDYDWKVLTPEWSKKLGKFADEMEKKYPNVRVSIQTSEKNWLDVQVGQK